jgi:hypothetical protein
MHAGDLYKEYLLWCAENGYRDPKHMGGFRNDMLNTKFRWERCLRVGGKVSSGYIFYKVPVGQVGVEMDAEEDNPELWDMEEE